ncbi:hypothetical protein I7I48_10781 [Histoplasma ohiense]|nr:hypothetical protein I7I48_10781 [Histoplasma ohiense (nom. inval.)]
MPSGRRTRFASWSALAGSGQAVKHKPCENVAVFAVLKNSTGPWHPSRAAVPRHSHAASPGLISRWICHALHKI